MTELVGDICEPSSFSLPPMTTVTSEVISGASMLSGAQLMSGQLIYNETLAKMEMWVGDHWETVTSTSR